MNLLINLDEGIISEVSTWQRRKMFGKEHDRCDALGKADDLKVRKNELTKKIILYKTICCVKLIVEVLT